MQGLWREERHLAASGVEAKRRWFGKPCFQRQSTGRPGCCATLNCVDLVKTHLAVPGRNERGAGHTVTGEHNRAVVHHGHLVRTLHSLAAREPAETRDMASRVFFLGTYVDTVDRLLAASLAITLSESRYPDNAPHLPGPAWWRRLRLRPPPPAKAVVR